MENAHFEANIEHFIGEINNYPEISNVAAEQYHNETEKRSVCINVCQTVCEGFDDENSQKMDEIYILQVAS